MTSLFDESPDTNAPTETDSTGKSPMERIPPHDLLAEQSVIGGMLLANDAIDEVADVIKNSRDYYRPAHQLIHDAILGLHADNEPADPNTVAARLRERGELSLCGEQRYLHTCVSATPTAANAGYYAEIVRDLAVFRRLTVAGMRITQIGYNAKDEAPQAFDLAQQELFDVGDTESGSTDYAVIADTIDLTIEELRARCDAGGGKLTGIPTGFADLDALTMGLQPGRLIVVAARPAVGKSTLGNDLARACAVENSLPCALFSLEMSRSEIEEKLLSAEGVIALHHITSGHMSDDDWDRVHRAASRLRAAPLFIDDSPNLSVMEVRAKARKLKQQHGIRMVIVDYLQLMKAGTGQKQENRQVEVSEISRQLKLLAKELHIPVVALSQLNRGPEQRSDKRPALSDLRESGAIEQDADMVILLHREDAHEKESPRAGEADLIVAKHRGGPTATITTAFQGHYSRFVDMASS